MFFYLHNYKHILKNKKATISTKKLAEFFAEKFMDCL